MCDICRASARQKKFSMQTKHNFPIFKITFKALQLSIIISVSQQFYFLIIFLRVKSWKSGVIRSFHMKFRKKSGIAQNQEKSGIIRKIRKCLTDCPLEKGGALHLNKLESPSPKDALCQVWLKLAQWFWRRF